MDKFSYQTSFSPKYIRYLLQSETQPIDLSLKRETVHNVKNLANEIYCLGSIQSTVLSELNGAPPKLADKPFWFDEVLFQRFIRQICVKMFIK